MNKTRYEIPYKGIIIELDIYHKDFEGKMTAEVEFDSLENAKNFKAPEWFGQEVTDDKRYKNKNLAIYGWPKED